MDMPEPRTTIKIQPDMTDLRGLLKALNEMDKDSQKGLKDEVYSISAWTAQGIKQAAFAHPFMPAQAAIIAPTVRASRDRLPTVLIGGSKGRASGGANAGQLLFGNEFGGERNAFGNLTAFPNGGYRFPTRSARVGRGNAGYWIFPTVKAMQPEITRRWTAAVEKVYDNWKQGI
jgi:hypothetical protein